MKHKIVPNEITLSFIGFIYESHFNGISWDGTEVDGFGIPFESKELLTKEELKSKLNDGNFGIQSMTNCEVYIYANYRHSEDPFVHTRLFYKTKKFNSKDCALAKLGI